MCRIKTHNYASSNGNWHVARAQQYAVFHSAIRRLNQISRTYSFESTKISILFCACTMRRETGPKGPVIRGTFFFNLSCNIVAVQVETLCCAYYHLRDQLVPQQNILLQISGIMRV